MEVNVIALELLMLALPGVLWAQIDAANRHSSQSGQFIYIVRCFLFGMISYLIVMAIYRMLCWNFQTFDFQSEQINFATKTDELLLSLPVAFLGSIFFVFIRTKGVIHKILNAIGISDYSGCEDIFEYSLSPLSKIGLAVHVRDFKETVTYSGIVRAYSDRSDLRELLLSGVTVTDFNGNELVSN